MLSTGYKNVTGCNYAIIINVFFFVFFKHDLHRITFMVSLVLISVCPWRKMRA